MSPESYILLMISGWLMVSAAMLWGMLRLTKRYHTEAHLSEQTPLQPATPVSTPTATNAPACRTPALHTGRIADRLKKPKWPWSVTPERAHNTCQ